MRARNATQTAPRVRGWSNWRHVARFVARFSRARERAASAAARPHVPCVRVQGPPGRWGKSQKLGVSDTPSFWYVSAAPAGLEPSRRGALRGASGLKRRSNRTRTVPMLHLDHRRPITFVFSSVRAGYTVGGARLGCTAPCTAWPRVRSILLFSWFRTAPLIMGSRRDEVRFFAIAEKTAMRVFSCAQKIFCAPTQLTFSKEVAV